MIRFSALIPSNVVGLCSYSPSLRNVREAAGDPPTGGNQTGSKPGKQKPDNSQIDSEDPVADPNITATSPSPSKPKNNQGKEQQNKEKGQGEENDSSSDNEQDQVDIGANSTERQQSALKTDNFNLGSNIGLGFLISQLVSKAKENNEIDSLAAQFVDGLKINNADDFKNQTKQFSHIDGYPELLSSIENMVNNKSNKDSNGLNELKKFNYNWKGLNKRNKR